jgi:hypothetical protein
MFNFSVPNPKSVVPHISSTPCAPATRAQFINTIFPFNTNLKNEYIYRQQPPTFFLKSVRQSLPLTGNMNTVHRLCTVYTSSGKFHIKLEDGSSTIKNYDFFRTLKTCSYEQLSVTFLSIQKFHLHIFNAIA